MHPFFQRLFRRKPALTARFCCHQVSEATGRVEAFDDYTETTMPKNADGGFDFCHACLGQMAIRCWICDRTIFVGDPITLYVPSDPFRWIPPHAAIYSLEHMEIVGCGRTDCAESGVDYRGNWVPSKTQREGRWVGGVQRRVDLLQQMLENGEREIVINDLSRAPTLPGCIIPERMPLPQYEVVDVP